VTGTIHYDSEIIDLIDEVDRTGKVTHKQNVKKSVTLHGNAGNLTHEGAISAWRSRGISMHFDIDVVGALAQGVIVNEYAWAVGNNVGNEESIHIDMANRTLAPHWEFSDATLRAAARLIGWLFVYVIDEHPSRDNILTHDHWLPSAHCPGPFIEAIFDEFLTEVQGWYENFRSEQKTPATFDVRTETPDDVEQIKSIQKIFGIDLTGEWDSDTDQAVLEFRRKHLRR
jgi:N-acetyl-anhydromuramyl-L-alanine amidase AmpD